MYIHSKEVIIRQAARIQCFGQVYKFGEFTISGNPQCSYFVDYETGVDCFSNCCFKIIDVYFMPPRMSGYNKSGYLIDAATNAILTNPLTNPCLPQGFINVQVSVAACWTLSGKIGPRGTERTILSTL